MIEIFSMDGKKVMTIADENFSEGNQEIKFNRESLTPGIYFLQLQSNEGVAVKKMVTE